MTLSHTGIIVKNNNEWMTHIRTTKWESSKKRRTHHAHLDTLNMHTKPSTWRGAERRNIAKEKRTTAKRAHSHVHNTMSFAEISINGYSFGGETYGQLIFWGFTYPAGVYFIQRVQPQKRFITWNDSLVRIAVSSWCWKSDNVKANIYTLTVSCCQ